MPFYTRLKHGSQDNRRTVEGLLRLQEPLNATVPARSVSDLLLATWNIRELESSKYGRRDFEPLHYIAEIISRFDLVAVQEVRDDLSSFNTLMGLLGGGWRYLLSDVTEGTSGNRERMAFVYDSRKVEFTGLAGEMVLPTAKGGGIQQVARTPYLVAFQAGWLKFLLCTVHIFYGQSAPDDPRRIKEIEQVAKFIAKRAGSEHPDSPNTVLLGDFNIFATTDATMRGITAAGFTVPDAVVELSTDLGAKHHYDQIAMLGRDLDDVVALPAGTFSMFDYVYRDEDEKLYANAMGSAYRRKKNGTSRTAAERRTYYRAWRTFQMSDHQPLWVRIPIDLSKQYLQDCLAAPPRKVVPRKAASSTGRSTVTSRTAKGSASLSEPAIPVS